LRRNYLTAIIAPPSMHIFPFTEAVGDRKYFLCISIQIQK
jgi:hypothetical protein